MISVRLNERQKGDYYLFCTASIHASIISTCPEMHSLQFLGDFLCAVKCYHDFLGDDHCKSQLWEAVKADEVEWGSIERVIKTLDASLTQGPT